MSVSGTGLPRLRGTYTPVFGVGPRRTRLQAAAAQGFRRAPLFVPRTGTAERAVAGLCWGGDLGTVPAACAPTSLGVCPSVGRSAGPFPGQVPSILPALPSPYHAFTSVSPSRCSSCRSSVSHELSLPSAAAASSACVSEPSAALRQPAAASTSELLRGSGALLAAAPLSSEGELRSVQ